MKFVIIFQFFCALVIAKKRSSSSSSSSESLEEKYEKELDFDFYHTIMHSKEDSYDFTLEQSETLKHAIGDIFSSDPNNPKREAFMNNFEVSMSSAISSIYSNDYFNMVSRLINIAELIVKGKKFTALAFQEEIEKACKNKPKCRKYKYKSGKLYEDFLEDIQCCFDQSVSLTSRTARMRMQTLSLQLSQTIMSDALAGFIECFLSSKGKQCSSECEVDLKRIAPITSDALAGKYSITTPFVSFNYSTTVGPLCMNQAALKYDDNLSSIKSDYYECLRN